MNKKEKERNHRRWGEKWVYEAGEEGLLASDQLDLLPTELHISNPRFSANIIIQPHISRSVVDSNKAHIYVTLRAYSIALQLEHIVQLKWKKSS